MLIQDTPRLKAFVDGLCIPRTNGLNKINRLTKDSKKTTFKIYIYLFILSLNVYRVVCVIIVFAPTLDVPMRRIQGLNLELLLLGATTSYLPTDAIERPNGDRRCGEIAIIFPSICPNTD